MEVLTFAGRYEDRLGPETIVWRVEGSRRYALPSLGFFTAIRGVGVWGTDFDSLEPVDTSAVAGRLFLNSAGELSECVLSGDLPCTMAIEEQSRPATITLSLDLHQNRERLPGGPVRRGAGSMPLVLRISPTVDAETRTPRPASSPWILR
jgi:hypothetical protein